MPYYLCPKCGSKDSYSGTEIVSEHKHKSGHMIAGPENGLGLTPVMRVGGSRRTEHNQLTVQKCRDCDILLGDKDLRNTDDELKQLEVIQEKKKKADRASTFNSLLLIIFLLALGIIAFRFLKNIYTDFSPI